MTLKKEHREKMIDRLIENDISDIIQAYHDTPINTEYLSKILSTGFKGYSNYTDDELIDEFNSREFPDE